MSEPAPWGLLLAPHAAMAAHAQGRPPGWLSASEMQRLAALRSAARQSVFVGCRHALRLLLAQDDGQSAHWHLGSAAERGPWVERGPCSGGEGALPQLSLSHSGAWLACAKAPVAVGVDIEVHTGQRMRDVRALADMVCSPAEQAWLLALPPAMQQQGFVQLWCLKEAFFKCTGTGLNLQKIRQWGWRSGLPSHTDRGTAVPTAYARLWWGGGEAGEQLCLALCARQPVPALQPRQAMTAPAAPWAWQLVQDWCLYPELDSGTPH